MKTLALSLLLISANLIAIAQSLPPSTNYDRTPVTEILQDLEAKTGSKFYYLPSWLDTLNYTGSFANLSLDQALLQLFEGTKINIYPSGTEVFLTYNTPIISDLPLLHKDSSSSKQAIAVGLVFQKEYLDQNNQTVSIGDRSKMNYGGQSLLIGRVTNSSTGEPIPNAIVMVRNPFQATVTDEDGFYSISLPNKKQEVYFQFVGMKSSKRSIVLFSDGTLNVKMNADIIALDEVIIRSDRDRNVQDLSLGISKINAVESKTMPMVLGERDLLKVATSTAGIQSVGEGANGYNIRGGKADQNLILFDGVPIYNSSHFFGFFSAFNTDVLKGLNIYKGSIPSSYGGRLSSVLEFETQKPNTEKVTGSGGISPVTSNVMVELPVKKGSSGLLLSGRTTYSNWLLRKVDDVNIKENKISFYDLTTKFNWRLNDQSELYTSGYFSKDHYRLPSDTLFSFSNFSYSNLAVAVGWNKSINEKTDLKINSNLSRYGYTILFDESLVNAFEQKFQLNELTSTALFDYYRNDNEKIVYGVSTKWYAINPGSKLPYGSVSEVEALRLDKEHGLESALFFSHEWTINEKWGLNGGLRYSMFNLMGPTTINRYDPEASKSNDSVIGQENVSSGKIAKTFHNPEFRLSSKFLLDENRSIKAGFDMTSQYIHALTNSASLSPTDIWRLSNTHIVPQTSRMLSIGYFQNFLGLQVEASIEGYYKFLNNLTDFKVGGEFLLNSNYETEIIQGKGKAYGVEISIKKSGRLNGLFNYSYARTLIKLNGSFADERINNGQYYPTSYDKPHTINLVANYRLTRRYSISTNLTFNSGRPMTVPVAAYEYAGGQSIHYSNRNAHRIPNYFRMDLGLSVEGNHKRVKPAHGFWTFSVYNVLGRDNPYSVFFDISGQEVSGYQLVIFGDPIPTITYHFKF